MGNTILICGLAIFALYMVFAAYLRHRAKDNALRAQQQMTFQHEQTKRALAAALRAFTK